MSKPIGRSSIGLFMIFVGLLAGGLAAMRDASDLADKAVSTAVLAVLSIGLLGTIVRRGRPGWLGFTLFGWMYLILSTSGFLGPMTFLEGVNGRLLSAELFPRLAVMVHPEPAPIPPPPLFRALPNNNDGYLRGLDSSDRNYALLSQPEKAELSHFQAAVQAHTAADKVRSLSLRNTAQICDGMTTLLCALAGSLIGRLLSIDRTRPSSSPPTPG